MTDRLDADERKRTEHGLPGPKRRVGHYEIVRQVGRGGMATVYLARQVALDRNVALKELSAFHASSPEFAERFLRESRLAGSLNHPNIVTVLEYFEEGGTPYIAMEYVRGGSLRPYVGRLGLAQFAGVMEGVLAGLTHAETLGIVHRDLKPENLMVTADGRVKIADFGIAKATQSAGTGAFLTATGTTVGTPTYMAPEQAMAGDVGIWTDLYSVGVMAYEHIVGRVPFHDTDAPMVILLRHVNETIPPAVEINPDVDPELSDWIDRLLIKDPEKRTRSALEAWEQLEEIVLNLLGPRWRREARLPENVATLDTPRALTPAPFSTGRARTPDPGASSVSTPASESHAPAAPKPAAPKPAAPKPAAPEPAAAETPEPAAPTPAPSVPAATAPESMYLTFGAPAAEASAPAADASAPAAEASSRAAEATAPEAPATEPAKPSAADVAAGAGAAAAEAAVADKKPAPSAEPVADSGYVTFGAAATPAAPPEPTAPAPIQPAPVEPPAPAEAPTAAEAPIEAPAPPEPGTPPEPPAARPSAAPVFEPAAGSETLAPDAVSSPAEPRAPSAPTSAPDRRPRTRAPLTPAMAEPVAEAAPAEAAAAEAAPAEAADELAPPTQTRPQTAMRTPAREAPRRGGSGRVVAIGAVAALAAVIGFVVAPSSSSPSHTASGPPLVGSASAGPLSISFPAGWQHMAATPVAHLPLTNQINVNATGVNGGTLVIGTGTTSDPSLLPAAFLSALPSAPTPQVVTLGKAQFDRYLDVTPTGATGPETVYTLPTSVGSVVAVCQPTPGATTFPSACERVVGTLQVSGTVYGLGPNPTYAAGLSGAMAALGSARNAPQTKLASAKKPADQASAANSLATAYQHAAAAVRKLNPGPAAQSANAAIATALAKIASGYSALSQAAAHNDGKGYGNARTAIGTANSQLSTAFSRLSKLGYTTG